MADIIPFYDTGYYHAFYLKGFADGSGWSRHHTPWAHIRSRDLSAWEELPDALATGTQDAPDGGACFTGSVIRRGERIHIFYTGFSPGHPAGREQIMHAVSEDGIRFRKNEANPVLRLDDSYYGAGEDFRDPYVFWNEEEGCYWMLFTAGERRPLCGVRRGVIGLAVSADMERWEFRPPLYAPRKYPSLECPDLFRIGDWWYLLFSQFGRTEYRMARSPHGPWQTPASPHFDAGDYFFYAAKTVFDGNRRFLLGWCGELAGGRDAASALWGGTFVTPRELRQRADGTLTLECPEIFLSPFNSSGIVRYNQFRQVTGEWTFADGAAEVAAADGFVSCFVGEESADVSVRLTIEVPDDRGSAGIVLRSSDDHADCYTVSLHWGTRTLALARSKSVDAFHGPALHGPRLLCARELPERPDGPVRLTAFLRDGILEVFVAGVTLTAPLQDIRAGRFGLFASETPASFADVRLS
ncbi:glycoside hydrolase family 32 protein [Paenibacillus cymbidii]|uniref:glycoside hydrolase family 32 protein n=1 Tax=Paenibacillus cymbidii TaxID=1639034 RepID=UPI001436AC62|nr:glycoside hydrolase family 32 protein [Paenibacillus cymbidii]